MRRRSPLRKKDKRAALKRLNAEEKWYRGSPVFSVVRLCRAGAQTQGIFIYRTNGKAKGKPFANGRQYV